MLKKSLFLVCLCFCSVLVMAQKGKIKAIESGITLKMQALTKASGQQQFFLNFQTNDIYECANYCIENDVKQEGNKLIIRMKGVRYIEPCTMGMAPAVSQVDLTALPAGDYKVRVIINRQVFKASLQITESYFDFQVANEDPTLFRIYNGHLNRIPANSIWGVCRYSDPDDKLAAEMFMTELRKAGAEKSMLPIGNYGDFYLHKVGETDEKVLGHEQYEFPFVYSYTGDAAALEKLVKRYQGKVAVVLKTSDGKIFKNE